MPSIVTLLSGPASSGKTSRLLERYRAALAQGRIGRTLWLSPTSRTAADIQQRILTEDLRACFAPGISTFARFTKDVVAKSEKKSMRPIHRLMKRQIVRQVLDEQHRAGQLTHFGGIASTAGLLDLLCEFIRQMKRLEIWPEQLDEACRQRGIQQKDRELLVIYQAYQQRLLSHNLYDAEGQFWSARDSLQQQPVRYELLVVDGFSDFTRTEHDMLQTLAAHAAETWISLPLEQCGREDLFQKPLGTREELRRRHPGLREESLPRPANAAFPALAHLERTIFSNPRTMQPASDTNGLEILVGGRQIDEIEMIGRRIKRLLIEGDTQVSGTPPASGCPAPDAVGAVQIAVVFRQVQPLADVISEVFQRLEIPFCLEGGAPLARSPAITMLLRLLELDGEDWPMHTLLGVLGNNYFSPDWAEWDDRAAADAETTIRASQIPRGRRRLLERLAAACSDAGFVQRGADPPSGQNGASARRSTHPLPTSATSELLRNLAEALDRLPRLDTLAAHAQAWDDLAARVGIRRTMRGETDLAAWEQLQQVLNETQQLAAWLGQDAPKLDRAQARAALLDIVASQDMNTAREESGRVRVLSASSARHLKIPYVFLAGLSEKAFPAAERDDGVFSPGDRQRLIDSGLPLPGRGDRQSEEMLLFYEAINAATRRLWLSYPGVNDSGEPLAPSPYVKEVEQACGATGIARTERTNLSPVPDAIELCSMEAFRIRAVADAVAGRAETLAGFAQHAAAAGGSLLHGLECTLDRQNRERFGPREGMLGEAAADALAADFPPDRIYSATELERYAYCPYRCFLEKLLRVRPLDDVALSIDYAQRGQMAHDLLAVVHRRVNEARGRPESPAELAEDDFARILNEAAAEALGDARRDSLTDAFREIDRRKLMQWLSGYRDQHAKYDEQCAACDGPPRPQFFEVSFGHALRAGQGPPSTAEPLELTNGEGTVRLSGRIDRIDVGRVGGQDVFNILDYKTSSGTKFSVEACRRGHALQLPVYALAAAELLLIDRDAAPWLAAYWYVGGDGFKPRQALRMYEVQEGFLAPSETWEAVRGLLADTVVGLVKAMRRGEFPVWSDDENCTGRCPYHTTCRINQVRSLEKRWRD